MLTALPLNVRAKHLQTEPALAWAALSGELRNVRWSGDRQFTACCPAHRDQEPSLSVSLAIDGRVLVNCFVGCSFSSIARAASLQEKDFFPAEPKKKRRRKSSDLITLTRLAAAKKFDVSWLNSIGVYDYPHNAGGVLIAYADENGNLVPRQRRRTAARAKDGSEWTGARGVAPVPYGLWRLSEARERRFVVIVEGETDVWALWRHGWPALGLPGAATTGELHAEHVRELDKVYVVQEPDPAGQKFPTRVAVRLKDLAFKGEVFVLKMPEGKKDPCDLHIAGTFDQEFQWSFENAQSIDSTTVPSTRRVDCNISGLDLELRTQSVFTAVSQVNHGPQLFSNSVEPILLYNSTAQPASLVQLRQWLTTHINFQAFDRHGNLSPITPSDTLIQNVLAYKPSPFPHLTRVVQRPVFTADGRLVTRPGYDATSGLFYIASPTIVDVKAGTDVQGALDRIAELVCDFHFESPADRAHFYAFLLQPIFREMIDGPTPVFRFEAPTAGTGKGLLFNVGARLNGGYVFTTPHSTEEEWGKSLLAFLRYNPEILLIDNCSKLDSDNLSAATTAWPTWTARLLGTQNTFTVPVRCLWAVTINNPQLREDSFRRMPRIRITPGRGIEKPWLRNGFKHHPLLDYLQKNLPDLIGALLTLAVFAKESMHPFAARQLGSYEEWARVMGGVVEALGIEGFLDSTTDEDLARDQRDIAWQGFLMTWHGRFGASWIRCKELISTAQETEIYLGTGNDRSQQSTLGRLLARHRGAVFGGLIMESRVLDGNVLYRVKDAIEG